MPDKIKLLPSDKSKLQEHIISLSLLLLLALLLRLVSFCNEPLINPDGIAYVLQAKAFFLQQTEPLLTVYPYPTNLALMIAGVYHLIGDWVLSGQLISLFFSLLTIIPFYFLNRIFWSRGTTFTIVILYVVSPVFVEFSHEIIRGPQFWFFLVLGLWAFCRFLVAEKPPLYLLPITTIAFLMAAWSRIEGLLPLFLAGVYLLFHADYRKKNYLAAYFLPFLLILFFSWGLGFSHKFSSIDLLEIFTRGFGERLTAAINRFQWLRQSLLNLETKPPFGVAPYFFDEARDMLFFLALGVSGHSIIKTFGHLFFLITIFGLIKFKGIATFNKSQKNAKLFLKLLITCGTIFIYIQILLNWCSSERFVALIYFPGLIFSGYGFNKIFSFIRAHWPNSRPVIYCCLGLLIWALPAILKSSHLSRSVAFKEIGQNLAKRNLPNHEIKLCSTSSKVLFTHFYAYLNHPIVSSPWQHCTIINAAEIGTFLQHSDKYDYLLFSDRDGARQQFLGIIERDENSDFSVLMEQKLGKYGLLTLFGLTTPGGSNIVNENQK